MPNIQDKSLPLDPHTVFFISDGTGITAETMGHAVLAQFHVKFKQVRLPFIDSVDKAQDTYKKIEATFKETGVYPIVFSTLVHTHLAHIVEQAPAIHMNLIATFIAPLEKELGIKASHLLGSNRNTADSDAYKNRIEAINFSLAHDDGQSHQNLIEADIILVGVSRSGKTPTSLYLAMQFGIKVANYPLIPEDFERKELPSVLQQLKYKIFGLTIAPERLADIRHERRPNSQYASLTNCRYEVHEAEDLMKKEGIRWLSSTSKSIEEIATTVLQYIKIDTQVNG